MVLQGLSSNIFPVVACLPCMQKIHLFAFFNQIGLHGEALGLHSISGSSSVEWAEGSLVAQRQPLSWYKVSILNFNQKNIDNKLKSRKNVLLGVALNYQSRSLSLKRKYFLLETKKAKLVFR